MIHGRAGDTGAGRDHFRFSFRRRSGSHYILSFVKYVILRPAVDLVSEF